MTIESVMDAENIRAALSRISGSFTGWALTDTTQIFEVDPKKFNRLPFTVGDRNYMVSVFVSSPEAIEATPIGSEESPARELPMVFESDHRRTNPKLHRLYVCWALRELEAINSFIEAMGEFSTFTASTIVSGVIEKAGERIMSDASWFEAAALIQAKIDLTPYLSYDQEEHESEELSRLDRVQ